jgi:hypothetical protein
MPASNVTVSISDPKGVYDGTVPYCPFPARYILLYRFSTEAAARAGTGGTLIEQVPSSGYTWQVRDPSLPHTAESGPYVYALYDANQSPSSWYRYRFAASDFTLSLWSEPWEADSRFQVTLREILYQAGMELGDLFFVIDAATNANPGRVVSSYFRSSVADPSLYEGWWVLVTEAGGVAPENQWAMIASVAPATGIATLDRDLSAPVTTGHRVLMTAAVAPDTLIRLVNRAREKMFAIRSQDYSINASTTRIRVPLGVKHEKDILEVLARETRAGVGMEQPVDWRAEFDGPDGWIYTTAGLYGVKVIRVRYLASYSAFEGNFTAMSDTTSAPIEWLRPAVAFSVADYLLRSDPGAQEYAALAQRLAEEATAAASRYGPDYTRAARRGHGRRLVAGPREV